VGRRESGDLAERMRCCDLPFMAICNATEAKHAATVERRDGELRFPRAYITSFFLLPHYSTCLPPPFPITSPPPLPAIPHNDARPQAPSRPGSSVPGFLRTPAASVRPRRRSANPDARPPLPLKTLPTSSSIAEPPDPTPEPSPSCTPEEGPQTIIGGPCARSHSLC